MQQLSSSANCFIAVDTAAHVHGSLTGVEPCQSTIQRASSGRSNVRTTLSVTAQAESFFLPGPDEVIRRVWHYKRDGQYVLRLFDIWQAELAGHFAYRLYETDTFRSITQSRHPIQANVLDLLMKTELVPATASTPFIVRTSSQVDRAMKVGA
jgi:hypothetical protein